MPEGLDRSHVVRIIRGTSGRLEMRLKMTVRFDYGMTIPWVTEVDNQTYSFVPGAEVLALRTSLQLDLDEGDPKAVFEICASQTLAFVLSRGSSHLELPSEIGSEEALERTRRYRSE